MLGHEAGRWLVLLVAALWLAQPYFSPRLIGSGDALWYHHLLADAVTQFRAGIFPVYVGQSEFMFNGAVYPHRVAPYHQYLAGALDLLTGRSLGFFALQHLTIIVSIVGGAATMYFALIRLAPDRRNLAVMLALVYSACPGVVGLAYAQDLYMSVMAIPWVPLALGGAWLSFRENSWRALGMIVAGIGMLWWAHAPIAMWTTALIGGQQTVRLWRCRFAYPVLIRGSLGCLALSALVLYPFVSTWLLRAPGEAVVPYIMDRALLLREISQAFPANVLPLDPGSSPLSQLQFGYALWCLLLLLGVAAAWKRSLGGWLGVIMGAFLLILVHPVPGLTRALWLAFPEPVVGLSLYWPMQRLVIVAAALIPISLVCTLAGADLPRTARNLLFATVATGVLWSFWEMKVFRRQASAQAAANWDADKWARSENVTPMRHAYHLFSRQPSTMSHGVMDPAMESRLLDPDTGKPMRPPAREAAWKTFTGTLDRNPGILNLQPTLILQPRRRYRLEFQFLPKDYTGILQIVGSGIFREYALPASGNPRAFGTGPDASPVLSLWTSGDQPVELQLRFIPTQPGVRAESFVPFARFAFTPVDPARLPVELHSLIPFRATVRSATPAVLETPRMLVPGYEATVNGNRSAVIATAEGMVGVLVPSGTSEVEVSFVGPILLRMAFFTSLLAWLLLPLALWRLQRRPID